MPVNISLFLYIFVDIKNHESIDYSHVQSSSTWFILAFPLSLFVTSSFDGEKPKSQFIQYIYLLVQH